MEMKIAVFESVEAELRFTQYMLNIYVLELAKIQIIIDKLPEHIRQEFLTKNWQTQELEKLLTSPSFLLCDAHSNCENTSQHP